MRSTSDPLVSFVIPVLNDADNLARCLTAIQHQADTVPLEIIVLDNGSTDTSRAVAASLGATVLHLPGLRVSALRNAGMRLARAPWIALIDADNQIAAGWLQAASTHFSREAVMVVGCDYSPPPDGTWVQELYDAFRRHPATPQLVRWLATGNMVVRRSRALEIEGFDETLETCEDVDFCARLRRHGGDIWVEPRMGSTHFGDPETLARLFRGELWRGRDALRVDLRGVSTWAELPSMILPVIGLASMIVAPVSALLAWTVDYQWCWVTLGSVVVVPLLALLKAGRRRTRIRGRGLGTLSRLYAVVLVYDVARALSIAMRTSHRRANAAATATLNLPTCECSSVAPRDSRIDLDHAPASARDRS